MEFVNKLHVLNIPSQLFRHFSLFPDKQFALVFAEVIRIDLNVSKKCAKGA